MKIALVIYGLPRGNQKVWRSIYENVIAKTSADVFIHTWLNISSSHFHHGLQGKINKILNNYLDFFKLVCGPRLKSITIDRQIIYEPECISAPWGNVTFSNQRNSLISIVRGMDKCINSENYDYILFTRSDVLFSSQVSDENINLECFSHSGVLMNERFECEDLFFGFHPKHAQIMKKIESKHSQKFYIENNIYNAFISEFALNDVVVSSGSLFYGSGISIHRSLWARLLNKFKKITKI